MQNLARNIIMFGASALVLLLAQMQATTSPQSAQKTQTTHFAQSPSAIHATPTPNIPNAPKRAPQTMPKSLESELESAPLDTNPTPLEPLTPESAPKDAPIKLEFLISYKAEVENGTITGEKYDISEPLIIKSPGLALDYTCSINTPINDLITDDEAYVIKYILANYQEEVLACLEKGGVRVRYDALTQELATQDKALLRLAPRRILAYFDNRALILEVLKEKK
ncbi:hypothetical protein BKN38_03225 [Helicobacter sp. CLO-3]|uniref:hypothetical protein n=1 Tax=unclassified Helicobacter TaxID=2593540 RepID=UPI00080512C5|nr:MULTISPECIES: hypothetical protein [unclassified Helicobacter]OBV29301.1 hypothetical protein BA723_06145 [Helicobacter sp. CLO-3]OHU84474.1 hypothetical protein BKN38_03225 [Helicobacter sp. CLO-3]